MDDDYKKIEDRFKTLPRDIQIALTSVEMASAIQEIAKKEGLLLDQSSVLFDLTSDILLGIVKSADFVNTLSKDATISHESATRIAQQINKTVFDKLRTSIRKVQESETGITETQNRESDISALEQIGDFEILKENESGNVIDNSTEQRRQNQNVENIEADNLIVSPKEIVVEKKEIKVIPTPSTPPAPLPPKPTPRPAPAVQPPTQTPVQAKPESIIPPPIPRPAPLIQKPVPIPTPEPIQENRNVPINRVQQSIPKPVQTQQPRPTPPPTPVQAKPIVKPTLVVQIPTPVITIPKPIQENIPKPPPPPIPRPAQPTMQNPQAPTQIPPKPKPEIKKGPEIPETPEPPTPKVIEKLQVPPPKKQYANDPYHEPF